MSTVTPFSPPGEFDGYRLIRLLGRGGMGEVHLALDTLLDRHVAIKFISSSQTDREARQRFLVEARAIARLSHPNVVSVYRVGEVAGYPYLVSEFVRGIPLDSLELPLSAEQTLRIAHDVSCALAAAHQRGVLHRDIKPANAILSDEGQVKLLDFGIAKLLEPSVILPDYSRQESTADSSSAAPTVVRHHESVDSLAVDATQVGGPLPSAMAMAEVEATRRDDSELTGITDPGVALGTPRYMAPEVWRGEGATFRSDIYSYGALIYMLASGSPPISGKSAAELSLRVQFETPRPLREVAPTLAPELCEIVHRCLERDPHKRYATGGELRTAVAGLLKGDRDVVASRGNPYRGLSAFEAEHRGVFFGRDSEIRMILDRLTHEAFVLVAGDSGVGKSSVCRAGVLPRIAQRLGSTDSFHIARIVPGKHPLTALAAALAEVLRRSEDEIAEAISQDPAGVARDLRQATTAGGFVLFVDQLEELVTLSDSAEATAVAELLSWLSEPSARTRLLATVRGDFLSRVAQLPLLGEAVARALYFLRPLSRERIREVITGPAATCGQRFESDDLVEELAASTERAEGGLPLLQFTLAEMWDARSAEDEVIRRESLVAIGGLEGSLARHGDSVLAAMTPAQREASRDVLCALVTPEGTRARLLLAELGAEEPTRAAALEALVRGRLVVAGHTPSGTTYEIAHEVLVRGWPTLSEWLAADIGDRAVRDRLVRAAKEWDRLGRKRSLLYARPQLSEALRLNRQSLGAIERSFVDASRSLVRKRRWLAALSAVLICATFAGIYGGVTHRARLDLDHKIENELLLGLENYKEAQAGTSQAEQERAAALALFDAGKNEPAEARWKIYREAMEKIDSLLSNAGRRFEAALLLDGSRPRTRTLMADWLVARFLLAEKVLDTRVQADLLQRLALYDSDGSRRSLLSRPGRVRFELDPASASVSLYSYQPDDQDRLVLIPQGFTSASSTVELAPGSYLAVVTAPGYVETRHPFTIRRSENLLLADKMPRTEEVPKGFIYIPAGRFLYGSAAQDAERRDFFHTVPLHEVETSAYLIARHETTYRDWLDYLRSLPMEKRAAASPRVDKGGFQGALSLKPEAGGRYRLSFAPTERTYTATEGEPIVYESRSQRAVQDWLDMPVSGISVAMAEAYAAFLDASGKVPRARLCTETEWERAARGADGREYPHGNRLHPTEANFDDTYQKVPQAMGPDQVGSYPASDSPLGLQDAAGNVWEWTQSPHGGYAARGGSFYFGVNSAKTMDREVTEPAFRDVSVGLRLCADPPNSAPRNP